ncbi:MAG TPA: DUF2243 domain-containing protein, partial [Microthrixaceae bacterium]|nr:DUF2243 domain-containing protein [Microthrixaceae bacterium]
SSSDFPNASVSTLEENTFWDGMFHGLTWVLVAAGLLLLWRSMSAGARISAPELVGLMLVGWGIFNLVEGVIDHHILTLHHVRDDVAEPLPWDLGFLALGAVLIAVGLIVRTRERAGRRQVVDDTAVSAPG